MSTHLAPAPLPQPLASPAEAFLDARSDPRVGVGFPIQIFSGDFFGALPASARDLGVGGVCMATSSVFNFKAIRRVCLDLPGGAIELQAEGRWQSESTSDDSMLTGVSFIEPEKEHISRLWDVVHEANKELGLFLFDGSDLSELCADDATNLASCSRYRLVAPRRRIYRQDECRTGDDSIFLVVRGEVSLMAKIGDHREVALERLTRGQLFGGLPAVADCPNQESAVADTQATLLEISRASFANLRIAKPLLGMRLAQVVVRCQLRRSRKLIELASLSA